MAIDYALLSQMVEPRFIGTIVSLGQRVVERDGKERPIIVIEVWDTEGRAHRDTMSAATNSQKRLAWSNRVANILKVEGPSADLSAPRYWSWESGGRGEFTFSVLMPGDAVEPPSCDDQDLAFLEVLQSVAGEATEEVPFVFALSFGNELAGAFSKLSRFGGDSTKWVRALHVKGVLRAKPGSRPDEVEIIEVL